VRERGKEGEEKKRGEGEGRSSLFLCPPREGKKESCFLVYSNNVRQGKGKDTLGKLPTGEQEKKKDHVLFRRRKRGKGITRLLRPPRGKIEKQTTRRKEREEEKRKEKKGLFFLFRPRKGDGKKKRALFLFSMRAGRERSRGTYLLQKEKKKGRVTPHLSSTDKRGGKKRDSSPPLLSPVDQRKAKTSFLVERRKRERIRLYPPPFKAYSERGKKKKKDAA